MGVLLQAFYWNCPAAEHQEYTWWTHLTTLLPQLQKSGFTALWLPPASKAANLGGSPSMGYDPYDYFDLGEFDQRGQVKTWFGSKADLTALTDAAHAANLQVYADIVINHNNGADAQEVNPLTGETHWTVFHPVSNIFPRDWKCFHPSLFQVLDQYPPFGGMPQLCHQNPHVYTNIMEYARRMIEDIGFDGFRFDYVKGFGPWMIKAIAERRYRTPADPFAKVFCVAEYWDSEQPLDAWLALANSCNENPVSAFDFPLRYHLKDLCDTDGYDLRGLLAPDTVLNTQPDRAVTFVDNHDTTQNPGGAVIHDKLLAYAFILTHQGYPCVFYLDYFTYKLARTGTPNGIDALIAAHEKYAGGTTTNLWIDHDLYIMQRNGDPTQPGLIFVLNNRGGIWNSAQVVTRWPNQRLTCIAWSGHDSAQPDTQFTDPTGTTTLYAAPRGYAVYIPS